MCVPIRGHFVGSEGELNTNLSASVEVVERRLPCATDDVPAVGRLTKGKAGELQAAC